MLSLSKFIELNGNQFHVKILDPPLYEKAEEYLFLHYFPNLWGSKYSGCYYTNENSEEARTCKEISHQYIDKMQSSKPITSLVLLNYRSEIIALVLSFVQEVTKKEEKFCNKCPLM